MPLDEEKLRSEIIRQINTAVYRRQLREDAPAAPDTDAEATTPPNPFAEIAQMFRMPPAFFDKMYQQSWSREVSIGEEIEREKREERERGRMANAIWTQMEQQQRARGELERALRQSPLRSTTVVDAIARNHMLWEEFALAIALLPNPATDTAQGTTYHLAFMPPEAIPVGTLREQSPSTPVRRLVLGFERQLIRVPAGEVWIWLTDPRTVAFLSTPTERA